MGKLNIRSARREDIPALARLKYDYVRNLYRGFLPMEVLETVSPHMYEEQFRTWMDEEHYQVNTAWEGDTLRAFLVYGENEEEKGVGLLYEGGSDLLFSTEDKRVHLGSVLDQLRGMGFSTVHLWILRDNFRVRVVFESLGFRPDGARRTRIENDQELVLTRYIYNL